MDFSLENEIIRLSIVDFPTSVYKIARVLNISLSTVYYKVGLLEKRGFVRRARFLMPTHLAFFHFYKAKLGDLGYLYKLAKVLWDVELCSSDLEKLGSVRLVTGDLCLDMFASSAHSAFSPLLRAHCLKRVGHAIDVGDRLIAVFGDRVVAVRKSACPPVVEPLEVGGLEPPPAFSVPQTRGGYRRISLERPNRRSSSRATF